MSWYCQHKKIMRLMYEFLYITPCKYLFMFFNKQLRTIQIVFNKGQIQPKYLSNDVGVEKARGWVTIYEKGESRSPMPHPWFYGNSCSQLPRKILRNYQPASKKELLVELRTRNSNVFFLYNMLHVYSVICEPTILFCRNEGTSVVVPFKFGENIVPLRLEN